MWTRYMVWMLGWGFIGWGMAGFFINDVRPTDPIAILLGVVIVFPLALIGLGDR